MGSAQVPQVGGKARKSPRMAGESGAPATPAVCSLARLWESYGTDNGSRVNREVPARFCERLRVKSLGSTLLLREPPDPQRVSDCAGRQTRRCGGTLL